MKIGRLEQIISRHAATKPAPVKNQDKPVSSVIDDKISISGKENKFSVPKKWTIMHYSAADNDLKDYLVDDVDDMEIVGSTNNMNLVVQLDQGKGNSKRYYLETDSDPFAINSPVLADLGETNMSSGKTLEDFIESAMKDYPAEHYALIISDHGEGWKGAIQDDSHDGWMTTPTIRKGIEAGLKKSGKKLDILGFDACLMGNTEVAYELKDTANIMVASQENEGLDGWPYTPLLSSKALNSIEKSLRSRIDLSPKEFAKKVVEEAKEYPYTLPTLAAIDLTQMDNIADKSDKFADAILKTNTDNEILKALTRETEEFSGLRDQYHFAQLVSESKDIKDNNLKKTAKGLMDSIKKAVIAEQHTASFPNAHGLTAEIPTYGSVRSGYEELQFRKNTKWAEAMNKINDAETPKPFPR